MPHEGQDFTTGDQRERLSGVEVERASGGHTGRQAAKYSTKDPRHYDPYLHNHEERISVSILDLKEFSQHKFLQNILVGREAQIECHFSTFLITKESVGYNS